MTESFAPCSNKMKLEPTSTNWMDSSHTFFSHILVFLVVDKHHVTPDPLPKYLKVEVLGGQSDQLLGYHRMSSDGICHRTLRMVKVGIF